MTLSVSTSSTKFQVNVANFKNPPSTYPINSITTTLVDSTGVTRASYTSTSLNNLNPDVLTTATITPLSN
jgi:hypothetical protein